MLMHQTSIFDINLRNMIHNIFEKRINLISNFYEYLCILFSAHNLRKKFNRFSIYYFP